MPGVLEISRESLMDVEEFAKLLNLSVWTIREMNTEGRVPKPVKHPWAPRILWDREEVHAWAKTTYPHLFKS